MYSFNCLISDIKRPADAARGMNEGKDSFTDLKQALHLFGGPIGQRYQTGIEVRGSNSTGFYGFGALLSKRGAFQYHSIIDLILLKHC